MLREQTIDESIARRIEKPRAGKPNQRPVDMLDRPIKHHVQLKKFHAQAQPVEEKHYLTKLNL